MRNKTDAELVALARSGEKDAFGELIERYEMMARRIAVGMVADEDIAREMVQEAILQAFLSLHSLRDETRFKSWFYGIVLNVCRSFLRSRKAEPFSLEALLGGISSDMLSLFDPVLDPQEVAEKRELHSLVLRAISALSAKDRAATLLFYYEQLSLQEIAAILGISVVAVKGRLHKSRRQLRERLSPVYADVQQRQGQRIEQGRIPMVKVKIAAVLKNPNNDNWVVVLLDEEGHRVLNIWVRASDALAIAMGLTEYSTPRPMTFQFMSKVLQEVGVTLEEVRVETLKDEIFYAIAKFRNGNRVHEVDARPSDAMALASLMQSPVYVAEEVFERCGLALPEGKTVQIPYGMHVMREQLDEMFRPSSKVQLTQEQIEQAEQQFIAFLTSEQETPR
jgi:RNA polymerase sigma factor (sigma-70 family)